MDLDIILDLREIPTKLLIPYSFLFIFRDPRSCLSEIQRHSEIQNAFGSR